MFKKPWIISIILIIALILVSCNKKPDTENEKPPENMGKNQDQENEDMDDLQDNEDDKNEDGGEETGGDSENISFEDIKIKPDEAYKTFKDKFPDVKVSSIELKSDDNSYHYEVEGHDDNNEYELKINPVDGKIIKEEKDSKESKTGEISSEDIAKIEDLIKKATDDAGEDYKVDEWELKISDGKTIFEIELKDKDKMEKEYKYDVKTGELIKKD